MTAAAAARRAGSSAGSSRPDRRASTDTVHSGPDCLQGRIREGAGPRPAGFRSKGLGRGAPGAGSGWRQDQDGSRRAEEGQNQRTETRVIRGGLRILSWGAPKPGTDSGGWDPDPQRQTCTPDFTGILQTTSGNPLPSQSGSGKTFLYRAVCGEFPAFFVK